MDTTRSVNGQRQTSTLNCEISIMWETKPMTIPQNISRQLVVSEQVTRPKTLHAVWWRWWRCMRLPPWPCMLYGCRLYCGKAGGVFVVVCTFGILYLWVFCVTFFYI